MHQSSDGDNIGEHAKVFYESCMSGEPPQDWDVAHIRDKISRQGYLDPRVIMAPEDTNAAQYDYLDEGSFVLENLLANFIKNDFTPFFDITLDADGDNFIVRLSLPENGFNSVFSESIDSWLCRNIYEKNLTNLIHGGGGVLDLNKEYANYESCKASGEGGGALATRMTEAAKALQLTKHVTDPALAEKLLHNTAMNAEYFVKDIKEAWPSMSEVRHDLLTKHYTEYTLKDLNAKDILSTVVDWKALLGKVLEREFQDSDRVQVYHAPVIREVLRRMDREKRPVLRNTLLLMWAEHLYTSLLAPVSGAHTSAYCLRLTQHLLPDISGILFLQSFSRHELEHINKKVESIVNNVKKTITGTLDRNPAVDPTLISKLTFLFTDVGAVEHLPAIIRETNETTFVVLGEDTYVENCLVLMERRRARTYSLMATQRDASHPLVVWSHFNVPHGLTPTYDYTTNSIVLPEGTMAPPYLQPHPTPRYLSYAGMGHLVSKSYLRAIDTTGIEHPVPYMGLARPPPNMGIRKACFKHTLRNFTLQTGKRTTANFVFYDDFRLNEMMVEAEAVRLAWLAYEGGQGAAVMMPRTTNRKKRTAEGEYDEYDAKHGRDFDANYDAHYDEEADYSGSRKGASVPADGEEPVLPWLGMTAQQLYLLKTAQTKCEKTSRLDLLEVMEKPYLPARLRVNLAMLNEPHFRTAFRCPAHAKMAELAFTCPFLVDPAPPALAPSAGKGRTRKTIRLPPQ